MGSVNSRWGVPFHKRPGRGIRASGHGWTFRTTVDANIAYQDTKITSQARSRVHWTATFATWRHVQGCSFFSHAARTIGQKEETADVPHAHHRRGWRSPT
eukprot:6236904-Prymnesium_polylepis.1